MKPVTKSWILLIVLACIWGSSFILMKRGMHTADGAPIFSDMQVGALRMIIAGCVMLPFCFRAYKRISSTKEIISLLVVGFSGNFFPAFLFTYAETELPSGLAGMLNSFTPFFTLIIGWAIFRQKLVLRQFLGLIIAFIGILFLVGFGGEGGFSGSFLHVGAVILATLFYAISLNTIKHTLSKFTSLEITAVAFSFLLIPALCVGWITDVTGTLETNENGLEGLGYIAILSVVGTAIALLLFNRIIQLTSAVFASSVTYFIPIVAVIMGVVFNHEHFQLTQLLGMGIVLVGVFIVNTKFGQKKA